MQMPSALPAAMGAALRAPSEMQLAATRSQAEVATTLVEMGVDMSLLQSAANDLRLIMPILVSMPRGLPICPLCATKWHTGFAYGMHVSYHPGLVSDMPNNSFLQPQALWQ